MGVFLVYILLSRDRGFIWYLREKKELSVIPFNILLYEAAEEVGVVDLFYRLSKIKDTTDSNYIFMKELDKLVEKIIEKIKELQMRMRWE